MLAYMVNIGEAGNLLTGKYTIQHPPQATRIHKKKNAHHSSGLRLQIGGAYCKLLFSFISKTNTALFLIGPPGAKLSGSLGVR